MLLKQAENDWIGQTPFFYNIRNGKISANIYEVIDYANFQIDIEGLKNYLEFGYSVFGHTLVKDVKYLMPCEGVKKGSENRLEIYRLADPVERDINNFSSVKDTWDYMEYVIRNLDNGNDSANIILPLSGGYDSRLIAYFLRERKDVYGFTYGISKKQSESYEIKNAQHVARMVGFPWEQIELNKYYEYIDKWIEIYGPSVHAHGMYHMEFYHNIKRKMSCNGMVVSGIIGDGWAGNVDISPIKNLKDVSKIGYSHGLSINPEVCIRKSGSEYKEEFFESKKYELQDRNWRVLWTMRTKMMLLRYLCEIPSYVGYEVKAPFLDYELCMKMLNLDWSEKTHRKWQTEFLYDKGLLCTGVEKCDYANMQDLQQLMNTRLEPLNVALLREYIDTEFLNKVNENIMRKPILYSINKNKVLNAIKYFSVWKCYDVNILNSLNSYLLLKPIESLLRNVELYNK